MKKSSGILGVISTLLFSVNLVGCGEKASSSIKLKNEASLKNKIEKSMSLDEVLKDIKDIDLYQEIDTKNMNPQIENDEDSSTRKKDYLNEDNQPVFSSYEGHGEESFDYYTESKSEKALVVKYIDTENIRSDVIITSDAYTVDLKELNKNSEYGADSISVRVNIDSENVISPYVVYELIDGAWMISESGYYAEDGYHIYYAYMEGDKIEENDSILYESVEDIEIMDMSIFASNEMVKNIDIIAGTHQIMYNGSYSPMDWLIKGEFVIEFSDNEAAKEFANQFGYECKAVGENDDLIVPLGELAFIVSDEFAEFETFATKDFYDYSYMAVKFNDMSEVNDISYEGVEISYY